MWEILTGEEPYANMHCGAIIGKVLLYVTKTYTSSGLFCDGCGNITGNCSVFCSLASIIIFLLVTCPPHPSKRIKDTVSIWLPFHSSV